jgi:hypothetical protein
LFGPYVLLLALSGIAMIVLAAVGRGQTSGSRLFIGLLGVAFLGYAFYLGFVFKGGHYIVFYYAFILPILLIVRHFRTRNAARQPAQAAAQQPYAGQPFQDQSAYGQPAPGQPAYGEPYGQPAAGQPPYGGSYGQPAPGQPPYGGSYGQPAPGHGQPRHGQPPK